MAAYLVEGSGQVGNQASRLTSLHYQATFANRLISCSWIIAHTHVLLADFVTCSWIFQRFWLSGAFVLVISVSFLSLQGCCAWWERQSSAILNPISPTRLTLSHRRSRQFLLHGPYGTGNLPTRWHHLKCTKYLEVCISSFTSTRSRLSDMTHDHTSKCFKNLEDFMTSSACCLWELYTSDVSLFPWSLMRLFIWNTIYESTSTTHRISLWQTYIPGPSFKDMH